MNNGYATQTNPTGRFAEGTTLVVQGHPVKAENGTFKFTAPFVDQPNGVSYHQWRRVGRNGEILTSNTTRNLRGARATRIEEWINRGIATVEG